MKRRSMTIGLIAGLALVLGVVIHKARAQDDGLGGGPRAAVMRRVASAKLEHALDAARVAPDQRERIHAVRDRVFRTLTEQHRDRGAGVDQALRLFEADRVDDAQLGALRQQREAEVKKVADVIQEAIVEVHGILRPEQRRALADYVREHRRKMDHE